MSLVNVLNGSIETAVMNFKQAVFESFGHLEFTKDDQILHAKYQSSPI